MSTNLSATMNATQPSNCYNPTALRIGHTIAYCVIFIISVVGNSFIGIIVYKTKTMRKPINYLIVNMAMSDLLFPIFLIPKTVEEIQDDDWPIRGHLCCDIALHGHATGRTNIHIFRRLGRQRIHTWRQSSSHNKQPFWVHRIVTILARFCVSSLLFQPISPLLCQFRALCS